MLGLQASLETTIPLSPTWPAEGMVEYKDISLRYREGAELTLKDINFKIAPKEKVR